METFEILWNNALKELENTVSMINYTTYIKRLKPVDIDGTKIILCAESELFASFTYTRLIDKINDALKNLNAGVDGFSLVYDSYKMLENKHI